MELSTLIIHLQMLLGDIPRDTVDKKPPANAGDMGSIPGPPVRRNY